MLRISRTYVFYKRGVLQNVTKFTEKTRVAELIFKKVKLATAFKKTPAHVISCEFSKLLRTTFLYNTSGRLLLNADDRKSPHDYWSDISFFSSFKFLILNDSILMDLYMVETFFSNLLLKSKGNH